MTVNERTSGTDELKASRARIVDSTDRTRRAIERWLHDGPQQHLVAMAVKLRLAENAIDESPDEAKKMLEELRGEVQQTVQQLRDIAVMIFPPLLGDRGLAEALRAAAARDGSLASVDVDPTAAGRYPQEIEHAVYFGIVDAMHHIDEPVALELRDAGGRLLLTLRGAGLSELVVMHVGDRIHTVGGTARMIDGDVVVEVPVPAAG